MKLFFQVQHVSIQSGMFGTWLLSSFNSIRIIQYMSLVASRLRIQGAGLTITRPMMEKANYAQKGGRSKATKHKTRSLSLHVVAAFSFLQYLWQRQENNNVDTKPILDVTATAHCPMYQLRNIWKQLSI